MVVEQIEEVAEEGGGEDEGEGHQPVAGPVAAGVERGGELDDLVGRDLQAVKDADVDGESAEGEAAEEAGGTEGPG